MQFGYDEAWEVIRWRERNGDDVEISQQLMWFEESAEFEVAIYEYIQDNNKLGPVQEELADTLIMAWHLAALYGCYEEVIKRISDAKVVPPGRSAIHRLSRGIRHFTRNKYDKETLIQDIADAIVTLNHLAFVHGIKGVQKQFGAKVDKLMRKVRADTQEKLK